MNVYLIGMAVHPPSSAITGKRLEELVFDTTHAALADAGVSRSEIDHVTIAACDELDGRAISSMLMAAPAGAQLRDETKCTDSGLTGLCLGAMRIESGVFELGLVVSWNKTSEAPIENIMRMRCEPFYTRPIGLNMNVTDALFAESVSSRYGIEPAMAAESTVRAYERALANANGMQWRVPEIKEVAESPLLATPLREKHRAPITDGAVALVIASGEWLSKRKGRQARVRIAGMGWRSEKFSLDGPRLSALKGFRGAVSDALKSARDRVLLDVHVAELDSQTIYHELAFQSVLAEQQSHAVISPRGGAFAQNPYFCNGLVNAVEGVNQLNGVAGKGQVEGATCALVHQAHGFAQQGNVAVVLERVT